MGFSIENAQQIYQESLEQFKLDHPEDFKNLETIKKEHEAGQDEKTENYYEKSKDEKQENIVAEGMDFNEGFNVPQTQQEAIVFKTLCHQCFNEEGENKMCTITIPHFKEIIVMAFTCPKCGYKSSETKVAGALSK